MTDHRNDQRTDRRGPNRVAAALVAALLMTACGNGGTTTDDGQETAVAVPDDATVYEIRGSATAGDEDLALSATVHDRDGVQEADVYLADLREPDPSEERVSGPPGTTGQVGGFELTIVDITDVDGADEDAEGAVREIVTVAVRDLVG